MNKEQMTQSVLHLLGFWADSLAEGHNPDMVSDIDCLLEMDLPYITGEEANYAELSPADQEHVRRIFVNHLRDMFN